MNYNLAVLATFQNESITIKEWLEHYIWQGVEHFYLINNDSTDNYMSVIQPFIENGYITLYDLSGDCKQIENYNFVFNQIKTEIDWLIVCDIDEYFFGLNEPLKDYLNKSIDIDAFKIQPYIFGSNNHITQPETVRTSFNKRSMNIDLHRMKCIVKPLYTTSLLVHNHKLTTKKIKFLDKNILLNHYRVMSRDYYINIKMNRGHSTLKDEEKNEFFWNRYNINEFEDNRLSDLVINGYNL